MRATRLLSLGLAGWIAASLAASAQGAQQTGTSVIRGRVFAGDTKRPLSRARVTVSAAGLGGGSKATTTDADGRYEIDELPAGRYTVAVTRTGYLRLIYGQRLPSERGKPLPVADNQVVSDIDFLLPRMSLISGRIVDETGEPIPRVRVFAMRTAYFEGRRRLVPVATDTNTTTDHAGHYRIVGLMPGSYFVMSDVRETWTVVENGIEQTLGYAPTYFPGTPSVGNARRITVGVSEEASHNDFPLISGRAATVSGTATDSEGRPLAGRRVSVMQEFRGPGFGTLMNTGSGAPVKADGSFRIPHLPPGEYTLQTSAATKEGASTQETAAVPIVLDGIDLDNVILATSNGWSLSGQVVADGGMSPTGFMAGFRIVAHPINGHQSAQGSPGTAALDNGRVRDNGTFTVSGIFGPARLRAAVPDTWIVKAITQNGRDVTDTVFEPTNGDVLSGFQVMVSDRVTTLSGRITDDKGAALTDGTVLVFSSDSGKWADDSRFVQAARPDQEGRFQIRGLPPGEYLAAAIDYVEEGMWNDPEYLASIRNLGQRFTLGEADTHALMLRLSSPQ